MPHNKLKMALMGGYRGMRGYWNEYGTLFQSGCIHMPVYYTCCSLILGFRVNDKLFWSGLVQAEYKRVGPGSGT